ncbi:SPOR domain-containing protein, partial [Sphingomonas sp. Ant20]|uniref:SPOR domain-containing protein n=1 Tax=Sphingomonas sp. Ant20 TaxID=104605 RepID=UPI000536A18C
CPAGTPTMLASRSEGAVLAARAQRGVRAISAGTGDWYVQIGAYDNAGVARAAWSQATRRFDGFSGRQPNGMAFRTNGEAYYRLSVGGFGRDEANQVCRRYRATGGACFVRQGAGDQMALWLRGGGVEVATR